MVGGKVEQGEGAVQTIIRESWEEAGIVLQAHDLNLVHVLNKVNDKKCSVTFFFKATQWQGRIVAKERHKFKDLEWHTFGALPQHTKISIRRVIEGYKAGLPFTEIRT